MKKFSFFMKWSRPTTLGRGAPQCGIFPHSVSFYHLTAPLKSLYFVIGEELDSDQVGIWNNKHPWFSCHLQVCSPYLRYNIPNDDDHPFLPPRLFGTPQFKQGPPLAPSEREFKIKNVPDNECIIVCVVSLEEVQLNISFFYLTIGKVGVKK